MVIPKNVGDRNFKFLSESIFIRLRTSKKLKKYKRPKPVSSHQIQIYVYLLCEQHPAFPIVNTQFSPSKIFDLDHIWEPLGTLSGPWGGLQSLKMAKKCLKSSYVLLSTFNKSDTLLSQKLVVETSLKWRINVSSCAFWAAAPIGDKVLQNGEIFCLFLRPSIRPFPPLGHLTRPEAQPARPEVQPARPEG